MAIVINGQTGIDAGHLPISNAGNTEIEGTLTGANATVNSITANSIMTQGQNVSPFSGFKNYIINGNFDIWQRGTSQTCTSAIFQYGSVDRFCLVNVEATNYTISRASVDGTEPFSASYFVRNVVPLNTTSGIVFDHHIEDLKRFSNKTVTLSMWVKGDAGKKIGFGYQAVYGTGGTPSASDNILGKIFILTGSWQKVVMTTTLPNVITGKTYGTNNNNCLRLLIAFSSGSNTVIPEIFFQSGTFDIAQVQLEEGSVATPFEQRPYGLELSLCQRYFWKADCMSWSYRDISPSSGMVSITIQHPVRMRITPTVVYTVEENDIALSSVTLVGATTDNTTFLYSGTSGRVYDLVNYTADAEL